MKTERQAKILEIIGSAEIETQEQLLNELKNRGVGCTQATISRDIKELRLSKEMSGEGYRYSASRRELAGDLSDRLTKIFRESVTSFDYSGNIIVIKTLPALASAACSAIDGMNIPYVVGTLAGDDTAFILMRDNASAIEFVSEVKRLLV